MVSCFLDPGGYQGAWDGWWDLLCNSIVRRTLWSSATICLDLAALRFFHCLLSFTFPSACMGAPCISSLIRLWQPHKSPQKNPPWGSVVSNGIYCTSLLLGEFHTAVGSIAALFCLYLHACLFFVFFFFPQSFFSHPAVFHSFKAKQTYVLQKVGELLCWSCQPHSHWNCSLCMWAAGSLLPEMLTCHVGVFRATQLRRRARLTAVTESNFISVYCMSLTGRN